MRKNILLFSLFIICFSAFGQQMDISVMDSTRIDSQAVEWQTVEYRLPSNEQIAYYQNDSRFQYGSNFALVNLLSRLIDMLNRLQSGVANKTGIAGNLLKILMYVIPAILIIILIIFIIFKAKNIKFRTLFGKKKLDIPEIDFYTEDVNEMNFDNLIASALKNKNYRLVTRFLYLKNLKVLSDNMLITWDINKTNMSYQYEIDNAEIRKEFIEITSIFDYVWYGEFAVDEVQFMAVENKMKSFNNLATNG